MMDVQNQIEYTAHVQSKDDVIEELNTQEVLRLVPMLTFLAFVSVIGITGNSLVCYIYRSKYNLSSSRWFIFFLAVVDLGLCVVVVPCEIVTTFYQYTFKDIALCKMSAFFNFWSMLVLGLLLLIISIDRYRKVCKPTHIQIDYNKARILCAVAFLFTFFVALPSAWIYDVYTFTLTDVNVTAQHCSFRSSTPFAFAYVISGMVMFVVALATICVLYCLIGVKIRQHILREKLKCHRNLSTSVAHCYNVKCYIGNHTDLRGHTFNHKPQHTMSKKDSDIPETCKNNREASATQIAQDELSSSSDMDEREYTSGTNVLEVSTNNLSDLDTDDVDKTATKREQTINRESKRSSQKRISRKLRRARARKATFSMFLISLAFVLCYLPLLCLLLARSAVTDFENSLPNGGRATYKFFLRLCFLNCAINPFLYGVSDSKFRQSCRDVVSGVYRRSMALFRHAGAWSPRA